MTIGKQKKRAGLLIANAIFWAAMMLGLSFFFKDRAWGGDLVIWLVIGFSLANGFLMLALGRSSRGC